MKAKIFMAAKIADYKATLAKYRVKNYNVVAISLGCISSHFTSTHPSFLISAIKIVKFKGSHFIFMNLKATKDLLFRFLTFI